MSKLHVVWAACPTALGTLKLSIKTHQVDGTMSNRSWKTKPAKFSFRFFIGMFAALSGNEFQCPQQLMFIPIFLFEIHRKTDDPGIQARVLDSPPKSVRYSMPGTAYDPTPG